MSIGVEISLAEGAWTPFRQYYEQVRYADRAIPIEVVLGEQRLGSIALLPEYPLEVLYCNSLEIGCHGGDLVGSCE